MADGPLGGVGFAAGGVSILQAVEALVDPSRLCGRCRHRGLLSASSTVSGLLLTKVQAKI